MKHRKKGNIGVYTCTIPFQWLFNISLNVMACFPLRVNVFLLSRSVCLLFVHLIVITGQPACTYLKRPSGVTCMTTVVVDFYGCFFFKINWTFNQREIEHYYLLLRSFFTFLFWIQGYVQKKKKIEQVNIHLKIKYLIAIYWI